MRVKLRAICYYCQKRDVQPGTFFCSQRCAALWADEKLHEYDLVWCPTCQDWITQGQVHDTGHATYSVSGKQV